MLGEFSHRTNKIIIAAMLVAFCLGLALLFSGCTAKKMFKTTRKNTDASDIQTQAAENSKTNLFDRSRIKEEDYSLKLIPIDPTKEMGHTTDPQTGEQQYRNAIPVYERKTKHTDKDLSEQKIEAKTNNTTTKTKSTNDETEKQLTKLSVPWYAFLILGFFGFATVIGLYFVHKLTKSISVFSSSLAALDGRLKKLEL
jgi:hypothetical protein